MNITPWTLYWIGRLDQIGCVCLIVGVCSGVGSVIALFLACGFPDEGPGWFPEKAGYFYRCISIFVASMVIGCLVPSSKEMAAILVIPKIVNNEKVQQIPSKILDLATDWLDALKPKK